MERSAWLAEMRRKAEELYDQFAPAYWNMIGLYTNESHLKYLRRFLEMVGPPGMLLSAACGAGRYDSYLLEAGHRVIGTDQSAGMLERARQRFPADQYPALAYRQVGLQEMDFQASFDGAICMDAMEHICPEDWPVILSNFSLALKPGGPLYFTYEPYELQRVEESYGRALALGLPVVRGEIADQVDAQYERLRALGSNFRTEHVTDECVYHFAPAPGQVSAWLEAAGFEVVVQGEGDEYMHVMARKRSEP